MMNDELNNTETVAPEETTVDETITAVQPEAAPASEDNNKVVEIAAASGAAVSAGGIAAGVAGACTTGGCALMSTGSLVGGGAAIAPIAWAGAPAYLGAKAINHYAFKEEAAAEPEEADVRKAARKATNIGALVGVGATATITVSNGIRTAAVFTKLSSIGGLIGAGPVAGGVMLALLPIATAGIAGAGVYYAKKKLGQTNVSNVTAAV